MIERICDNLKLSNTVRTKARSILQYCDSKHISPATSSKTWCATCIWLAIRNDISYSYHNNGIKLYEIANTVGISTDPILHLKRRLLDNGTLSVLSLCNGIIKNIANYQVFEKTSKENAE